MQPGTRLRPLAADRDRRHADHLRDFFKVETSEKSQLDDLRFSWVEVSQVSEGVVYRHEVTRAVGGDTIGFRDINDPNTAAVGALRAPAGHIDQDVPHQPCGHREKVSAVLPVDVTPVEQPNKRLVHERRGLKHMPLAFAP